MFLSGVLVFFALHLVPFWRGLRGVAIGQLGERFYLLLYSLLSAAGLALIIAGYESGGEGFYGLFSLQGWLYTDGFLLMLPPCIFLAGAYTNSYIRHFAVRPMSLAVAWWAGFHLLVNTSADGLILFSCFFVYGCASVVVGQIQARGAVARTPDIKFDLLAVIGGVVLFAAICYLHGLPLFY